MLRIDHGDLYAGELLLLEGFYKESNLVADPKGLGVFIHVEMDEWAAWHKILLGRLAGVIRWAALHRYEPFWNTACTGVSGGDVPVETQFMLLQLENGQFAVLVPVLDGAFRSSLQGEGEEGLALVVESNDRAVVTRQATALFLAVGERPFELLEKAAESVAAWLKTGRLRREKGLPTFIDQFGWCTWDAFYQQVSHTLVLKGLESFKQGGVQPRLLILDDGWQSVDKMPSGEIRLTGFAANNKFPGGLKETVRIAKEEYGIETFTVWHAVLGYWGGVDGRTLPGYGVRDVGRSFGPGILRYFPRFNEEWWGHIVGTIPPENLHRFYNDYHRSLREEGVDGVKVDNQAVIEGVSAGYGGRVSYMRAVHEALEGSAQVHFQGNLTNCMSNANEMLYGALNSNLTRTSTDFFPWRPETHGQHLYVNALMGAWFGEFIWPDWDMFQSVHPAGGFHAAGRAVSGAPVFVSDKPDEHNFDLLRKLVMPDGYTLRALRPGKPTMDCLFVDPTKEDVLYKIFNLNSDSGVVGVFNCRFSGEKADSAKEPIMGAVRPGDVDGLDAGSYVVYAHFSREIRKLGRNETWELGLAELGYEVFTVIPIRSGAAPIGLVDAFNSAGAVMDKEWITGSLFRMKVRGSGLFFVWIDHPAVAVRLNGNALEFSYNGETNILAFELVGKGTVDVEVKI